MLSILKSAPRGAVVGLESRWLTTSAVALAKKKVIDPTLPVPPRGPPTAYTLFFKDYIPTALSSHQKPDGKTDMKALTAAAGQAWSQLASSARSEFESAAAEAKKTYDKEYQKFWDATTPETRTAIARETGKSLRVPGGKKRYNASVAARSGNPGKPLSAYFAFAKEIRDTAAVVIPDDVPVAEKTRFLAKETGKRWKELGETDQQKYKDTYAQQKEAWEEWKKTQKDL